MAIKRSNDRRANVHMMPVEAHEWRPVQVSRPGRLGKVLADIRHPKTCGGKSPWQDGSISKCSMVRLGRENAQKPQRQPAVDRPDPGLKPKSVDPADQNRPAVGSAKAAGGFGNSGNRIRPAAWINTAKGKQIP